MHSQMPPRMLIEYKFFEPAFYHTDLPDWGTAYLMATKLGEKAQVLIDSRTPSARHEHRVHRGLSDR